MYKNYAHNIDIGNFLYYNKDTFFEKLNKYKTILVNNYLTLRR